MKGFSKSDLKKLAEKAETASDLKDKIHELVGELESIFDDAYEIVEATKDAAQTYYDDRSEKWQESEAGEAYNEWIDGLSEAANDFNDFTSGSELDFDQLQDLIDKLTDLPEFDG